MQGTTTLHFFLQLLSEAFLILRKMNKILSEMYSGLHVKHLLLLSDFSET